jgi:hypothetical protein
MAAPTLLAVARAAAAHPTNAPTTAKQALHRHPAALADWGPLSRGAAPAIASALMALPADRIRAVAGDPDLLGPVAGRTARQVGALVSCALGHAAAHLGVSGWHRLEVLALAITLLNEAGAATDSDREAIRAAGRDWVDDWQRRKDAPVPAPGAGVDGNFYLAFGD